MQASCISYWLFHRYRALRQATNNSRMLTGHVVHSNLGSQEGGVAGVEPKVFCYPIALPATSNICHRIVDAPIDYIST
jgi:hypothetical protein